MAQTTVTYIHTDALGSVVAESDANDKDAETVTKGAVLTGKTAPTDLRGQKVIIETIERRYPK